MKKKSDYVLKLKDQRWRDKRYRILVRDRFCCHLCGETEYLEVHHRYYEFGRDPWDYPDDALVSLCRDCHQTEYLFGKDSDYQLLRILKEKGFMAEGIAYLCDAFQAIPPGASELIVANVVRRALVELEQSMGKNGMPCNGTEI